MDLLKAMGAIGLLSGLGETGHKGLRAERAGKEDFFGRETNLTVSGQLEGETYAMALGVPPLRLIWPASRKHVTVDPCG